MGELPIPFYDCRKEYDMKKQEQDDLFGRLDERTSNTWNSVEKIEKHLVKLNSAVVDNAISCAKLKTSIKNLWVVLTLIVIVLAGALGLGVAL